MPVPKFKRRRRWRRRALWGTGTLVLLLVVLVAAAPFLAGWLAPGIAERAINERIAGRAEVRGASFSWLGGQSVGPVTIATADGKPVADLRVNLSQGVWGLLRAGLGWGPMDLGTNTLTGELTLVRRVDGTTNLEEALAPRQTARAGAGQPGPGGETRIPPKLSGTFVIERLDVRYIDESRPAGMPAAYVELPGLNGKVILTNSMAATVDLTAHLRYGPSPDAPTLPGGEVSVAAKADSLTDGNGRLTPDKVRVEADIGAKDISVDAADALAGLKSRLVASLGERMDATVNLRGTVSEGTLAVRASSPASRVDLALRSSGGVITAERPGVIEINSAGLARVTPGIEEALRDGTLTLETLPRVVATLDQVRLPSSAITGAGDWRGASVRVAVDVGEVAGRVRVPEGVAGAAAGELRPFRVDPLRVVLESGDVAQGVTLKGSTSAALNGEAAGRVTIDMTAGALVDAATGKLREGLPAVQGKAEIAGVSTAIVQPLVEGAGLDLPRGVGPQVDLTLTASRAEAGAGVPGAAASAGMPATNLELQVRSEGVKADAALVMEGRTIRSRGEGASVAVKSVSALAGGAARKSGVELIGDGFARASVKELSVAWDEAGKVDPQTLTATVESAFGNMSLRPIPAAAAPGPDGQAAAIPAAGAPAAEAVAIQQVFLNAGIKPGAEPKLDVRGSGNHRGSEFFIQAILDVPGLREALAGTGSGLMQLRPAGGIELRNLPTSLGTMAMGAPPPAPGGMDVRRLIEDALGPAVTAKLDLLVREGGDATARDVNLTLRSDRVQGQASASVDSRVLEVKGGEFSTNLTPELASALLAAIGSPPEQRPTLAAPARARLVIEPLTVPMDGLTPRLAEAGDATVRLEIAGPAVVQNVVLAGAEGQPARNIGSVGVKDLAVRGTVPLAALGAGSSARPATAEVSATLLRGPQEVVGTLRGSGEVALAGGAPSGPAKGSLSLDIADTQKLDEILAQPGMVSGAVGETLKVEATGQVDLAPKTAAAAGTGGGSAIRSLSARASIASPRLNTTQPFELTTNAGVATLSHPAVLAWRVEPAWAARFLPAPAATPENPSPQPLLALREPTEVSVSLYKLSLAMGGEGGGGPMKPGVFAADAEISAPSAVLEVSGVRSPVKNLRARAASGNQPNVLGFSLRADDVGSGAPPGGGPALNFEGGLYGIADAQGNPTFGTAKVTGTGKAYGVPTAIIDAAARQDGLLVAALGPTASVTAQAKGASLDAGEVTVDFTSERATSKLAGVIRDGVFVQQGDVSANLSVITPELGQRITKGIPIIGAFEKTTGEAPALVTATGLTAPLDGDLSKLNGKIRFDPGEAVFTTSTAFGKLLKVVGRATGGLVGRKLEPLDVTIASGVVTYDRYTLPLGEFTVQTRGMVDLVRKRLDVVTYVPLGSLSDEVAGVFNTGLGSVLGRAVPGLERATMVPIRTTGSFDSPETRPDVQLFVKEAGETLLRPENIQQGIGDLLDRLGPKPDPKK
ncbi:MAG: hypothetical protein WD749_01515 [Phycisphaerales bacterium]